VVNIILKESERPVYTQADLGFGRYGYNSLDLMFGGKIGKDKKIFPIQSLRQQYGPRTHGMCFNDQTLYNTNQYLPFGLDSRVVSTRAQFQGRQRVWRQSAAHFAQMPHESRMFGINLTWRGLHFTYHRMLRFDHTALGTQPLWRFLMPTHPTDWPSESKPSRWVFKRQRKRRTTYTNLLIFKAIG
jgi:hypothetical protein